MHPSECVRAQGLGQRGGEFCAAEDGVLLGGKRERGSMQSEHVAL